MQQIDGRHRRRLESHGIPRNTRSSKGVQIKQQLLPERNSRVTLRVAKWTSRRSRWNIGTLIVHADNAGPHTRSSGSGSGITSQQFKEENGMARAPHPSSLYSPDLAPSDFYLFGYMKHCPRGQSFEADDELFSADGEMHCNQW
jgi:hypothetical protein